ncbi:MAG: AMP-binding protein [Parvibaculum sp.]|uniref:AMP-binding protein n=1 Tax=Parvibaculum sp. TaxID=2024848 RepID=UPI003C73C6C8
MPGKKADPVADVSGWKTRLTIEMIERFTASGEWRGVTLAESATARARDMGTEIAVVDGAEKLTYADVLRQAHALAATLRQRGLKAGDVLSFQLPNWYETAILNVAASLGGFIVNPIVPIYRDAEVGFILKNSRTRALFIPERFRSIDYLEMVERLKPDLPELRDVVLVRAEREGYESFSAWTANESDTDESGVDPNAIKLLLYTSGTTGDPKGVLHSHNTLQAEVDAVSSFWALKRGDVVLMPSPVTHITGYIYALELCFALGIKIVFMDRWDASDAVDLIAGHGATFSIGATPFLVELVTELERRQATLPTLRLFACGGAPVPPEIIHRAGRVLPSCLAFRVYGSSEAPTVSLGVAEGDPLELGAVTDGCIVNHEVRIVNPEDGSLVAPGEEGEILTRGPELMLGYTRWQDTLDAFDAEGYFRTGDIGFISHDRYLTISGRKKDLIIRGGENISAKEIEDILHKHPAVAEAAVVAMPHPRMGETPAAYVVPRPGASFGFEEMARFLEEAKLARQKIPERLFVIAEMPRTASGKVLKHVLRARCKSGEDRPDEIA